MILLNLDRRTATVVRLVALALIARSVVSTHPASAGHGRGLVVLCRLVAVVGAFLWWTAFPRAERITPICT